MLRNIIPMNLLLILQSLNISGSALTWTIENEENSVNVNLKWTRNYWKRNNDSNLNVRNGAPPKRRKTPSAIKRDRERKEAYLAKRNTTLTPGSYSAFKGITPTACLPTPIVSYVVEEPRPVKVSTYVQTCFDNTKCISIQTDESQFKVKCHAVAVQTELSRSESFNTASQTDFEVSSGHEVEVQTESAVDLCHQSSQTEPPPSLTTITSISPEKPPMMFNSENDNDVRVTNSAADKQQEFQIKSSPRGFYALHEKRLAQKDRLQVAHQDISSSTGTDHPVHRETEKILRARVKNGKKQYLIKWKHMENTKNTWVSESNLDSSALQYLKAHTIPLTGKQETFSPDQQLTSKSDLKTKNCSEYNAVEKHRAEIARRRARRGTLKYAPKSQNLRTASVLNISTSDLRHEQRHDLQIVKVQNRYDDDDRHRYLIYNVVFHNGSVGKVNEDKIPPRLLEQFLSTYPKNCYEQELDTSESESEM